MWRAADTKPGLGPRTGWAAKETDHWGQLMDVQPRGKVRYQCFIPFFVLKFLF